MSLYHKHRPKKLSDLVGQDEVVASITASFKKVSTSPRCVMFVGGSGCGKTTTARILKDRLKCSDGCFHELNCADTRGIEDIRRIRAGMRRAPVGGKSVIYLIDEAHQLTKDAQDALLKMLEDGPKHVWFFLCTTEPNKLKKTIHTRATVFKFRELTVRELSGLATDVATKEKAELDEEVADRIGENSEGSPRKALVLLDQIINIDGTEAQLDAIEKSDHRSEGIELARMLLNPRSSWADVAALLKNVAGEPEGLRRLILGYMSAVMLGKGKMGRRAYQIATVFTDHFYDTGKPGLVRSCYECVNDLQE